ncbi:MAG: sulfatase-like hydrolase/transferase, partial [Verrucomicrobiia bacterium]
MRAPSPMNVLLITSDQQRWDCLGRLNSAIKTPNLDRLADRGILFDRAYTVNPVCTPSRCSLLTGQYPSKHGCFHVGTNLPDDTGPT